MSDEPTPELARLLDQLEEAPARPEFAAQLKRQFVEGSIDTGLPAGATPVHEGLRRPSWGPIAAGMLAAAAAIALVWMNFSADSISFEVLDGVAGAEIRIDGTAYDLGDGPRVSRALLGSSEIRTLDQPLFLRVADLMTLELGPESQLEILELSAGARAIRFATDAGSLALATGPGFEGNQLSIKTPDGDVAVLGTAFAVHVFEDSTCICCTDGEVSVSSAPGQAACARIPRDESNVFRNGESIFAGPAMEDHVTAMERLQGYW